MKKLGGGSLLIAGIFLILFGLLIGSWIVEEILDFIGFVIIAIGVVMGIVGLFKMFTGGKGRSSEY